MVAAGREIAKGSGWEQLAQEYESYEGKFRELSEDYAAAYHVSPEFQESFMGRLVAGAGGLVPQTVAASVPGTGLVALQSASFRHAFEDARRTAERNGEVFDEEKAFTYALTNSFSEMMLEKAGIDSAFGKWMKEGGEMTLKQFFKRAAIGFAGEGLTEAAQGGISDMLATTMGIEERDPFDLKRRGQELVIGGLLGNGLASLHAGGQAMMERALREHHSRSGGAKGAGAPASHGPTEGGQQKRKRIERLLGEDGLRLHYRETSGRVPPQAEPQNFHSQDQRKRLPAEPQAQFNFPDAIPGVTATEARRALRDVGLADRASPGSFQFVAPSELDPARVQGMVAAQHLAALFGRRIVTFRNAERPLINGIKNSGHPDLVFLNADSTRPFWNVTGHELWHDIQRFSPQLAAETWAALKAGLINYDKYEALRIADGYSPGSIPDELMGDALSDALADPTFWVRLESRNPTRFRRFVAFARAWFAEVLSTLRKGGYESEQYFRDVEKVHNVLADVVNRFATNDPDARLGPYHPDDPNQNFYSAGKGSGKTSWDQVRQGDDFNAVKGLLPYNTDRPTTFDVRGTAGEVYARIAAALRARPIAVDPDGVKVLVANPEGRSHEDPDLVNRAEHLAASKADRYKRGPRVLDPDKARWISNIWKTIGDYGAKISHYNDVGYVRKFGDGTIHVVFIQANKVVRQEVLEDSGKLSSIAATYEAAVVSQRALDRSGGLKGAEILKPRSMAASSNEQQEPRKNNALLSDRKESVETPRCVSYSSKLDEVVRATASGLQPADQTGVGPYRTRTIIVFKNEAKVNLAK